MGNKRKKPGKHQALHKLLTGIGPVTSALPKGNNFEYDTENNVFTLLFVSYSYLFLLKKTYLNMKMQCISRQIVGKIYSMTYLTQHPTLTFVSSYLKHLYNYTLRPHPEFP